MLKRRKINLNDISKNSAFELIQNALDKGVNVKKVFVDTVGSPEKYERELYDRFSNYKIEFKVTAKADSLYPTVSAASIVAKVTRDFHVKNWLYDEEGGHEIFGMDFGCGYPSDEKTKKWLNENLDSVFGYPSIVRFSWSTTYKILRSSAKQINYENYIEDDDEKNIRQPFIPNQTKIFEANKKFNYFEKNNLKLSPITFK